MTTYYNRDSDYVSFRDFLNSTFGAVALGLLASGAVAYLFQLALPYLQQLFGPAIYYLSLVAAIGELAVALYFSAALFKMSGERATFCYGLYCFLTGLSLSFLIGSYTSASVIMAFLTTAVLFGCMAIIGNTTKVDLTRFGSLFMVGLTGIIVVTLLNSFFFHSSMLDLLLTYVSIIIFLGLIAFDVQRLQSIYHHCLYDREVAGKMMVFGAFQLYLDFINLFIRILQLFGNRNRRD